MVDSCEEKTSFLQSNIQTGLGFLASIKTKTMHITEPLLINQRVKSLINKRKSALSLGDKDEFHQLRNLANRECKACWSKHYIRGAEHLKECSPAQWWTEVKKLSGTSKASGATDNIIKSLEHLNTGDVVETTGTSLPNCVNEGFLIPMKDFQP